MCQTRLIDCWRDKQTIGIFARPLLHLSIMTCHGFALAFILALPLLHCHFYGQNEIIIIAFNIRHITGRGRERLSDIVKLEIPFDIPSVKHCHGTPRIIFKHKRSIIIPIRKYFIVSIDDF